VSIISFYSFLIDEDFHLLGISILPLEFLAKSNNSSKASYETYILIRALPFFLLTMTQWSFQIGRDYCHILNFQLEPSFCMYLPVYTLFSDQESIELIFWLCA